VKLVKSVKGSTFDSRCGNTQNKDVNSVFTCLPTGRDDLNKIKDFGKFLTEIERK